MFTDVCNCHDSKIESISFKLPYSFIFKVLDSKPRETLDKKMRILKKVEPEFTQLITWIIDNE